MPKPSVNQTREGPSVHPTMSFALLVQVGAIPGCPGACPVGFTVPLIARGVSSPPVGPRGTAGLLSETQSTLEGMTSNVMIQLPLPRHRQRSTASPSDEDTSRAGYRRRGEAGRAPRVFLPR